MHSMKLSNGTAGGQVKDSGRDHGGAGWYGGEPPRRTTPPAESAIPALSIAEGSVSEVRHSRMV